MSGNLFGLWSKNCSPDALAADFETVLPEATSQTLWHAYKSSSGHLYYYNSITGHTQWEIPIAPMLAVEAATTAERQRVITPPGTNLFIFHIPNSWDDTQLAMHFTPFGNLVSAKVQRDASGNNAGFGFVRYDNPDSAAAAVRLMNGFATDSKFLKVEFKKTPSNKVYNNNNHHSINNNDQD
ncbi:bifunctional RNA recognition motif domain/WW domain/Nucleotide-binding alpha-beta plait domain superfamily/WW domain superfamily/RNA-binding domain superfamily [Babesia duncani]|uniref:Bifunctional RNA recognition motif domain/WW domain/Nucleotide-binding alpha-beta plait domain superfamily/WW domain superfamily/RNA-binding domain superfamily n=1 Tax=Babesia duncani TaxID=323732 RepID=A0AAD9PLL2_9APIC|nr:bifunctional RNA recognition motif domain/WW domain/Nucleotide-binding alpha-beta plait domain superfamily/WW domain superfamily/RNA-binding domain superfamily [Babesia duncani]